jgi:hypothetical protein
VRSPHVTGCATAHEPGGTAGDEGKGKATACSFALDVKGALRAVLASSSAAKGEKEEGAAEEEAGGGGLEVDGAFHVARIVSDPEFEGGIGPLNVEVALDAEKKKKSEGGGEGGGAAPFAPSSSSAPSLEAAIESARGEIARRIVEAVRSVVKASESPRKAGGEKEKEKEGVKVRGDKEKGEVKVGGEAS